MDELLELIGNLQDCPWAKWSPGTLRFCEAAVCESIVAPAETWSNLGYGVMALILLLRARRAPLRRGLAHVEFRFGLYALVIGLCSGLFHASHTYVFETADLAAMNFLGIEMVIQGLRKLGWLKGHSPIALGAILFLAGLMMLLGTAGIARLSVFGAYVLLALWLEALIFVRARRRGLLENYASLGASLGLFLIASVFWYVDYAGLVCQPDRHWFSGHAAWHVVNAGCFLTLSRFYRAR